MGINFLAALDLLNTSGGALDTHAMVLTDGNCYFLLVIAPEHRVWVGEENIPSLATGAAMAKAAMEMMVAMTAENFILK